MLSFVPGNSGHFSALHDRQNIKILNEDGISIASGSTVPWHGTITDSVFVEEFDILVIMNFSH